MHPYHGTIAAYVSHRLIHISLLRIQEINQLNPLK